MDAGKTTCDETRSGPEAAPSGVERAFERLLRAWSATASKPSRSCLLFGLLLGAICAAALFIGAVPTFRFGHDDFFFLENGWRAIHGQRPQLDYFSSWGPVTFLAMAFGLKLARYSPNGIGYANAAAGLAIGLWAFGLGRKRLTSNANLALALYLALLVCSPYALGTLPLLSTHAMLYNRYGYALVALAMVECFMPVEGMKRGSAEYAGGFSTGAAAAITLFLKASFFAASIPFVAASFVFFGLGARRLVGLILGFSAVGMAFMAYLRFDFAGVLVGLRAAAGARAETWSLGTLWHASELNVPSLGLAVALGIGALFLSRGARTRFDRTHAPLFMALLVYFADIALLSTNSQSNSLPLLPAFALLAGSWLSALRQRSSPAELRGSLPFQASLFVLCGVLLVPQAASDAIGLAAAAWSKAHPPLPACAVRFDEPRLSGLILCDSRANRYDKQENSNGSLYTSAVNEGAALLRLHATSADKVLTMDMQNPFPYALGWPPPGGGMASVSFDFTFSARYRPSFDAYFGDATIVMLPRRPAQSPQFIDGFYEIYLPAMEARYRLAAESGAWRLYKKR